MRWEDEHELWIGKNFEGYWCELFPRTSLAFAGTGPRKLWKILLWIAGSQPENRTVYLSNTRQSATTWPRFSDPSWKRNFFLWHLQVRRWWKCWRITCSCKAETNKQTNKQENHQTNKLSNSMEQNHYWETDSSSVGQEILRLLRNSKVHKSLLPVPILNNFPPYFFKINFNLIF
jgi:hypothetical protein